jgi:tetratricopeptide (TPR) repeat protein
MKRPRTSKAKATDREREFYAEAEYADSMLRDALGDREGTVSALRWSLELKPTYAPAILSMGSVEYQLGRRAQGRKLFRSLLSLPENTPDLCQTIDEAGSFLIQIGAYKDGLELFRAAIEVFPAAAVLHQGVGCCAGHEGYHEEAVAASERALQLEPGNQKFVNDLGWCLFEAGRLEEAGRILERAVAVDPSDELARENLRFYKSQFTRRQKRSHSARDVSGGPQEPAAP